MNINWYPGHMTRAVRMMREAVRQVDAVCEIIDARIPRSSGNPDLADLACGKPVLRILNRADQADPVLTDLWEKHFAHSIRTSAGKPGGVKNVVPAVRELLKEKLESYADKGQPGREIKLMVAGIPNVGKSTFINAIAGGSPAKTGNKPGVTRGKQWINAGKGVLFLDTPGLLWPKLNDESTGLYLAYTGAIRREVLDTEGIGAKLLELLRESYPELLFKRYKFTPEGDGFNMLAQLAVRRGFLLTGAEPDLERCAGMLLDEFRNGLIGRITLEKPS